MREGSRPLLPRGGSPHSHPISTCISKAPRTKSLPPSRAWLATCLQRARMRRLPLAICFCCRGFSSIGGIAHAGPSDARGAAVLFLLDADPVVRRTVAGALAGVASSLSPTEVRRLIAVRNWRPENERAEVDVIVRKARASGIDCAQWEAGGAEAVLATAVDGAATQGFLLVSPAGRKKRISSILIKGGIADAWSGEPESRRRIEATLAESGMDAPMLAVSRSYLDRVLSHQLALSVEGGAAPP